jgi:hypothetical protein
MTEAQRRPALLHEPAREYSSFRDPAGFLYWQDGQIFRRILSPYEKQLAAIGSTGLAEQAVAEGLLLPYEVIPQTGSGDTVAVLKPRQIPLITYPYEWSFDQLKDAALVTLDVHLRALDHGMLLKDASAYNIQFVDGRPCLIDHLSFDFASDYAAWPAYGQFCRHFLAPLALMAYVDLSLNKLAQLYIDGIPLDLAASLLPRRTRFRPGLYLHLHLHAKMQAKHADTNKKVTARQLTAKQMAAFASSLRSLVAGLEPRHQATEWGAYYDATNYSDTAFEAKRTLVRDLIRQVRPATVWDVGGNNGEFSRSIADLVGAVVCMDIDPSAVNANYRICKDKGIRSILPLIVDLTNPSPALGFANRERRSLSERGRPDLILALALVHHLAISNNLPFDHIASYFAERTDRLLIEFVAKSDSQVQRLLLNRRDIFPDYTIEAFRAAFGRSFHIDDESPIPGTDRTLFLLSRSG